MNRQHNQIGIMNGRLSPMIDDQIQQFPIANWKNEFGLASKIGFELIEWIFDHNPNPIMHDDEITTIKKLSTKNDVCVKSICADYFMKNKIFGINKEQLNKNLDVLKKLIRNSRKLGVEVIVIPLLEKSSIRFHRNQSEFINNIRKILDYANDNDVILALETDLNYTRMMSLIQSVNHQSLKINYDVGNSIALGHDITSELEYLIPWIINVHIKDRKYKSHTVQLGCGDVDFKLFFSLLARFNYKKNFIIQGVRMYPYSQDSDFSICKRYYKFVNEYVKKYLE